MIVVEKLIDSASEEHLNNEEKKKINGQKTYLRLLIKETVNKKKIKKIK